MWRGTKAKAFWELQRDGIAMGKWGLKTVLEM